MKKTAILKTLKTRKTRSAWDKAVIIYANEVLRSVDLDDISCMEDLLNGASTWTQYSEGGCSLIYDRSIARRCCSPSELRKVKDARSSPNSRESWLDVQARALYQAARIILNIVRAEA